MSENDDSNKKVPALEVVLTANGVEVARTSDKHVWLKAMAEITGTPVPAAASSSSTVKTNAPNHLEEELAPRSESNQLAQFARELGVTEESLVAAAYPTESEPYIQLDAKYWEAFRRISGYGRTAPSVLVATLLLLWDRQIKAIGDLATRDCAKIFTEIGLNDKNPTRSIRNCDWLQLRGSTIMLNPANISRAEEVARTYCNAKD